jgi:hypothetical protein
MSAVEVVEMNPNRASFTTWPVGVASIGLILGLVIGILIYWPEGHVVQQFACDPNLMAQSPLCTREAETDVFGSAVGGHVSFTAVSIVVLTGAILTLLVSGTILVRGRVGAGRA